MDKEEMLKAAEMWEADARREDLARGYRAMARRQAEAWRNNAKELGGNND